MSHRRTADVRVARALLAVVLAAMPVAPVMGQTPAHGTNTGLVGHQFNIGDADGISLAEGEAAVFLPLGTAEAPEAPPMQT